MPFNIEHLPFIQSSINRWFIVERFVTVRCNAYMWQWKRSKTNPVYVSHTSMLSIKTIYIVSVYMLYTNIYVLRIQYTIQYTIVLYIIHIRICLLSYWNYSENTALYMLLPLQWYFLFPLILQLNSFFLLFRFKLLKCYSRAFS